MHVRRYEARDLSAVGTIFAVNNETDVLGRYMTRDIFKYYTSYRRGCLRFVRREVANPGTVAFVLETDPSDYPADAQHKAPEVIGSIIWIRTGTSDKAKEWLRVNSDWWTALNRGLMSLEQKYNKVFTGAEPTYNHQAFNTILPVLGFVWDKEIFPEAWEVDAFNIHRDWQRKGLSKMLLSWGLERAQEETVPIVVKASPVGNLAYRRAGFKSIGFMGFDKYLDELEFGGEKMQLWVWEPEIPEGSDIQGDWAARAAVSFEAEKAKRDSGT